MLNKELPVLAAGLSSMGLEVKTTTNGQFSKDSIQDLIAAGLKTFNFSVHSLDPERFLKFQIGRGSMWAAKGKRTRDGLLQIDDSELVPKSREGKLDWAQRSIDRSLENILAVKEAGADVKINTVVSTEADIENAEEIFAWAKAHKIPLRLLNDLGNSKQSNAAIRMLIEKTGSEEVLRKVHPGSSSCSTIFRDPDGYEFGFKHIRDKKLETMCGKCPRLEDGSCEEQFYGVRLQESGGKMYVLLCIQELNPNTIMTVEEFLQSDQLKEIQSFLHE